MTIKTAERVAQSSLRLGAAQWDEHWRALMRARTLLREDSRRAGMTPQGAVRARVADALYVLACQIAALCEEEEEGSVPEEGAGD